MAYLNSTTTHRSVNVNEEYDILEQVVIVPIGLNAP